MGQLDAFVCVTGSWATIAVNMLLKIFRHPYHRSRPGLFPRGLLNFSNIPLNLRCFIKPNQLRFDALYVSICDRSGVFPMYICLHRNVSCYKGRHIQSIHKFKLSNFVLIGNMFSRKFCHVKMMIPPQAHFFLKLQNLCIMIPKMINIHPKRFPLPIPSCRLYHFGRIWIGWLSQRSTPSPTYSTFPFTTELILLCHAAHKPYV